MVRVNTATNGNLLMATTMGEALQSAGKKLLVVSAGSTGSSFLLNHKVSGGAILHMDVHAARIAESGRRRPTGPAGERCAQRCAQSPGRGSVLQSRPATIDPTVAVLWFTDPDTTAHEKGIGDPETVECLTNVDAQFKRVLDGLSALGQLNDYDIWVTSDHGFTTHTGGAPLQDLLKPFARPMPDGSPRIVTGGDGAIYVRDHDKSRHRPHRRDAAKGAARRPDLHGRRHARIARRLGAGNAVVRRDPLDARPIRRHHVFARLDRRDQRPWIPRDRRPRAASPDTAVRAHSTCTTR